MGVVSSPTRFPSRINGSGDLPSADASPTEEYVQTILSNGMLAI